MRRPFICIILTYIFLLSACGRNEQYEHEANPYAFQYAMEQAALRRENILLPDDERILYLADQRIPSRMSAPIRVINTREPNPYFTIQDAIFDAGVFFSTLRDYYGAYVYFGGDAVFNEMMSNIEMQLTAWDAEVISYEQFVEIMYRQIIHVIYDRHFRFHTLFGINVEYFRAYCDGPVYERSKNGFKNINTGLYLESINGHEIADVMRLFADERGNLLYRPILLINMLPFLEMRLYQQFNEQNIKRVVLPPIYFFYENNNSTAYVFTQTMWGFPDRPFSLPALEYKYGIPVLSVMRMGSDGENTFLQEHAASFLFYAEYLRDAPIMILDLRNNSGGNIVIPTRWLYHLTGEVVRSNSVTLTTEGYMFQEWFDFAHTSDFRGNSYASHFLIPGIKPFNDGYHIIDYQYNPRKIIEREQLLIILTSGYTASSAETMVDLTFNVTNTLVIGTPTAGALLNNITFPSLFLPRSGIPFGFGRRMNVFHASHFQEGAGFTPDVWVDGDALAVTLALLRNAGLLNA